MSSDQKGKKKLGRWKRRQETRKREGREVSVKAPRPFSRRFGSETKGAKLLFFGFFFLHFHFFKPLALSVFTLPSLANTPADDEEAHAHDHHEQQQRLGPVRKPAGKRRSSNFLLEKDVGAFLPLPPPRPPLPGGHAAPLPGLPAPGRAARRRDPRRVYDGSRRWVERGGRRREKEEQLKKTTEQKKTYLSRPLDPDLFFSLSFPQTNKKARPPRARHSSASASSSPRSSPRSSEGSTALPCGSARRRATRPSGGWPSSPRAGPATTALVLRRRLLPPPLLPLLLPPPTPPPRPTTSLSRRAWARRWS